MSHGGAARSVTVAQNLGRWLRPSLAVLLCGPWATIAVAAGETVGCASISLGRLDVMPESGSGLLPAVEMQEGDTLAFMFQGDARAAGTITLVAADGREQRLRYGSQATQVSYTAHRSGAVGIRLAAQGRKLATFITSCSPAHGATVADGLNVDIEGSLLVGATAWPGNSATARPSPNASTLQWLGGEQPGKEASPGAYGVNLKLQPALTVGVTAQFDQPRDPLLGPSSLSDQPWLAGPLASLQLGGGLSLDAHAAWGSADPATGHAADRQTVDARLTSKQEAGAWRFSPSIGFTHAQEKVAAVAAEPSLSVPGQQKIESGRVDLKPEMAYRLDTGLSTYIEPKIMVGTFWNLGDAAAGAGHEGRRMAETGITFGAADGTKLQVGGAVEEGETRAESVWSGKIELNIPLR